MPCMLSGVPSIAQGAGATDGEQKLHDCSRYVGCGLYHGRNAGRTGDLHCSVFDSACGCGENEMSLHVSHALQSVLR